MLVYQIRRISHAGLPFRFVLTLYFLRPPLADNNTMKRLCMQRQQYLEGGDEQVLFRLQALPTQKKCLMIFRLIKMF